MVQPNFSKLWTGIMMVLAQIVFSAPARVSVFSCKEASTKLLPCQSFLTGNADIGTLSCQGARQLKQFATSHTDHKAMCACLKQAAVSANVNPVKIEKLSQVYNEVGFKINRYKDVEMKAFRPNCPGMGHPHKTYHAPKLGR